MTAKPRATAAAAPAGAAPSYGQLTRTMRPSNPHAPDYGTLPVYEQGLAEVLQVAAARPAGRIELRSEPAGATLTSSSAASA